MKYLIFLFTIVFFSACSNKATNANVYKKDPQYTQYLQYTKVLKVVKEDNVKVIANITYLNSADPKNYNNKKQNFLITTYYTDEVKKDLGEFTINKKTSYSKTLVKKTDEIYKKIAVKNNWSDYYIYSFETEKKDKSKDVTIEYSHPTLGNNTKKFKKEL